MKRVYHDEDDIWSDYGKAFEQIRRSLKEKYPHVDIDSWNFDKAYISNGANEYTVSSLFTAFDIEMKEIVLVNASAKCSLISDEISASCGDRMAVDWDILKKEYVLK